jgi:hypothetical protein
MTRILYRPLGSDCEVRLRPVTIDESMPRVLPAHRKPAWPHTALALDYPELISVGTLVELEVAFAAHERRFSGRGVVSWIAASVETDRPHRLGVVLYSLRRSQDVGGAIAEPAAARPPVPSRRESRAPSSEGHAAASQTMRQEGPIAEPEPSAKDKLAFGATAAMLSPLRPLTAPPSPEEISELLTNLIGEEVKVTRATTALRPQDVCMMGEYVTEDGEPSAAALLDLRLAVYLGSALAMIPASAAEADIQAHKLTAEVRDNTKEIFNIATSLVSRPGEPHRKLGRVFELSVEPPTGALAALLSVPPFRQDFEVEVPGYGRGRLTYLSPALQLIDDDIAAASHKGPDVSDESVAAAASSPAALTAVVELPDASDLADLLTNLVGAEVGVTPSSTALARKDGYVLADYVTDDGSISAVIIADVKIANFLGAALAMIPANAAEKDARAKKLSDEVRDNVQEIFNISASLFNKAGGSHHRFRRLYLPHKDDLPVEIGEVTAEGAGRVDVQISVPGYGEGRLALCAAFARPARQSQGAAALPEASVPAATGTQAALPDSGALGVLLPEKDALAELLTGLVGEEVGVSVRSEAVRAGDLVLIGAYVDDEGRERLLCGFDLRLANYLGAALAMIPAAASQEEIVAKRLSSDVFDNVKEICNIASGALNQEGSAHVKLKELHRAAEELPGVVTQGLDAPIGRLDLEVEVPGYGSGKLVVLSLA